MHPRTALLPTLLATLFAPSLVHATNGYLSEGYGIKAQGQAGVGIAWAQDALAAATNPAGIAFVPDRVDLGLTWFIPRRSSSIIGNAFGPDETYSGDGKKNFFLPEIAYVKQLPSDLAAGIALYGNGGLNTQYDTNPYARFGATGTAGVNLEQLFITPSLAWKPTPEQSLGIAVNIAYQRFAAQGIGFFGGFSSNPANVSNNGTDTSWGAGIRLGWTGTLAPGLTLGATWASKVQGKFDKYSGLFADGGGFDVPSNYGLGVAYRPNEKWTIGADVQRILYSGVPSVGNPIDSLLQGVPLGANNGPGFGWRDITVGKLGLAYQVDPNLVVRGGFSTSSQPVLASQTFFNILAPGVVQTHYTLGGTWTLSGGNELSGFFAYAPNKTVNGSGSIPPGNPPGGFGGGNANIQLKETSIGISYAWKL
jgi:long-chain fatty acid transport protein